MPAALQHDADPLAQLGRRARRVEAEHADLAGGPVAVALEDLDRRRLARAVGPEQAEHLAAAHGEVDAAARPRARRRPCAGRAPRWRHRSSWQHRSGMRLRLRRHRLEHHARAGRRRRGRRACARCSSEKAFTRLGRACGGGELPPEKIAEVAARGGRAARGLVAQLGARRAARRRHRRDPRRRQRERVRRGAARARAASSRRPRRRRGGAAGVRRRHPHARRARCAARVAVVDVGGGSTEIAVGRSSGGVDVVGVGPRSARARSPTAPATPTRRRPPSCTRCARTRTACSTGSRRPRSDAASRSAAAPPRCAGSSAPRSTRESLARAIALLVARAERGGRRAPTLDPRARALLPAGLPCSRRVGRARPAAAVGDGGLREGVLLELAGAFSDPDAELTHVRRDRRRHAGSDLDDPGSSSTASCRGWTSTTACCSSPRTTTCRCSSG